MARQGTGGGKSARFGLYGVGRNGALGIFPNPFGVQRPVSVLTPIKPLAAPAPPSGERMEPATLEILVGGILKARYQLELMRDMRALTDNPWSEQTIGWMRLVTEGKLLTDTVASAKQQAMRGPVTLPAGFTYKVDRFLHDVNRLNSIIRPRSDD